MRLTLLTSWALKICVVTGVVITVIGLLLSESDVGDTVLWIGLLVIIISPLVGILATYYSLLKEKDMLWAKVATVLIIVLAIGMIISIIQK